jgi:hypothetical protein
MPKYDPRYIYPRGYDYGNTALGLADLLGQGFDRLHKWNQDAQGQDNNQRDYLMKLQEFMQQNEDRTLDRGIKQQTADLQGKQLEALLAKQKSDAALAESRRSGMGKIGSINPFETTTTPVGQPVETPVGPAEPPSFLQRLAQTRTPITLSQAMQKANLSPDELNSGLDYTALGHLFPGPKEPKAPKFGYGAELGTYDESTGKVATPVPAKVTPPPTPSHERNLELKARAQLRDENGGTEPTADAVAARALKLDENSKINVNLTEGQGRQDILDKKELLPGQRTGVVNQYGQPVTGSITPARIRDEGLLTLRPSDAQAVAQVAQITAPFGKMLNAIEKGKFPQATGGSVHDYLSAYKNQITGEAKQFSDPDIAAFRAAQQNILFPLIRFEGGGSRQAIAELQMRMKANPSLLDTDVSAAAQAEQIAEIVETRLKTVGLTPSPELQKELDRAHELATQINSRVSANQGQGGGGFLRSLLGGGGSTGGAVPPGVRITR